MEPVAQSVEEILAKYSKPGLKRHELSRYAKKDQLSYQYPKMDKEERDKILNQLYGPEK